MYRYTANSTDNTTEKIVAGFQSVSNENIADKEKINKICLLLKVFLKKTEDNGIYQDNRIYQLVSMFRYVLSNQKTDVIYLLVKGFANDVAMFQEFLCLLVNGDEQKITATILCVLQHLINKKEIENFSWKGVSDILDKSDADFLSGVAHFCLILVNKALRPLNFDLHKERLSPDDFSSRLGFFCKDKRINLDDLVFPILDAQLRLILVRNIKVFYENYKKKVTREIVAKVTSHIRFNPSDMDMLFYSIEYDEKYVFLFWAVVNRYADVVKELLSQISNVDNIEELLTAALFYGSDEIIDIFINKNPKLKQEQFYITCNNINNNVEIDKVVESLSVSDFFMLALNAENFSALEIFYDKKIKELESFPVGFFFDESFVRSLVGHSSLKGLDFCRKVLKSTNEKSLLLFDKGLLLSALSSNSIKVLNYLAKIGKKIFLQEYDADEISLHWAAQFSGSRVMRFLFDNEFVDNVDAETIEQETPLFYAIKGWNIETITYLVEEQGANISVSNLRGEQAIHVAARLGYKKGVSYLLKQGASIDDVANNDSTLLHFAVESGNLAMITWLISLGANINTKNDIGQTPLDMATREAVINYLRELGAINGNSISEIEFEDNDDDSNSELIKSTEAYQGEALSDDENSDIDDGANKPPVRKKRKLASYNSTNNIKVARDVVDINNMLMIINHVKKNYSGDKKDNKLIRYAVIAIFRGLLDIINSDSTNIASRAISYDDIKGKNSELFKEGQIQTFDLVAQHMPLDNGNLFTLNQLVKSVKYICYDAIQQQQLEYAIDDLSGLGSTRRIHDKLPATGKRKQNVCNTHAASNEILVRLDDVVDTNSDDDSEVSRSEVVSSFNFL